MAISIKKNMMNRYVDYYEVVVNIKTWVWFCKKNIIFYFSGIIYDVIVEPPSIGSTTDEQGNSRPVSEIFLSVS